MKKKFLLLFVAIICVCCVAIGLTACDPSGDGGGGKGEGGGGFTPDPNLEKSEDGLYGFRLLGNDTYELAACYDKTITQVTIPSTFNNKSVTSIGDNAFFSYSSLANLSISDSIVSIGADAFYGCGLKTLIIPDNVAEIGFNAFGECPLETVTIPTFALERMNTSGLKTVTITKGSSISDHTFSNGALESITLSESVTNIGAYAFAMCRNLESVTLPSSVKNIGQAAFSDCDNLKTVKISDLAAWCDITFEWDSSNPLTNGADLYLNGQRVTELVVPNGVTAIKANDFAGCASITTATIPASVTSLGDNAFCRCNNLVSITILGSNVDVSQSALTECAKLTEATLPIDTLSGLRDVRLTKINIIETEIIPENAFDEFKNTVQEVILAEGLTTIGNYAFGACGKITEISLPQTLTYIGDGAFTGSGLTSITLPERLTYIGDLAFGGCEKLEHVDWPIGMATIGNGMFSGCTSLTAFEIPGSVTSIGNSVFLGTGLTSITIPEGVTEIGGWTFADCYALSEVHFNAVNCQDFEMWGSDMFNRAGCDVGGWTLYFGNSVERVPANFFVPNASSDRNSASYLTEIIFDQGSVCSSIGVSAFAGNDLITSVIIPDSVVTIDDGAFAGCGNLFSVVIGRGVTNLADGAFSACYKLVEVFNLAGVDLQSGMGYYGLGYYAIDVKSSMSDSQVDITEDGFVFYTSEAGAAYFIAYMGEDTELTLPQNYNGGNYAVNNRAFFEDGKLKSISLPNNVTSIGDYTFQNCTVLEEITIGSGVKYIGEYAFAYCSALSAIEIPDSVDSINDYTFYFCRNLKTIKIGSGVTNIVSNAFTSCSAIESITVSANNNVYASQDGILYNKAKTEFVLIPNALKGEITISEGITTIGNSAFNARSGITSVILPEGLTAIGTSAFNNCYNLVSITLPASLTTIGNYAFNGCRSLTSIIIPVKVTTIGENAFNGCEELTAVYISNLTAWCNIEFSTQTSNPLYYAHDLYLDKELVEHLVIPNGITNLGKYAFIGGSFASITISADVTTIGSSAFNGCTNITSITLPTNVTYLTGSTFSGCVNLAEIIISDNVTYIGANFLSGTAYYNDENNWQDGVLYLGKYLIVAQNDIDGIYTVKDGTLLIAELAFSGCADLEGLILPSSLQHVAGTAISKCENLAAIYYAGTKQQWNALLYNSIVPLYYYSDSDPYVDGVTQDNFWHYDEGGNVAVWTKEND